MYDLSMFIRYLVSLTQVLKDTLFWLDNWRECGNLFIFIIYYMSLEYLFKKNERRTKVCT
jgi:hypothetical protein